MFKLYTIKFYCEVPGLKCILLILAQLHDTTCIYIVKTSLGQGASVTSSISREAFTFMGEIAPCIMHGNGTGVYQGMSEGVGWPVQTFHVADLTESLCLNACLCFYGVHMCMHA